MSAHRQHYIPMEIQADKFWTPIRIAFAVTYAAAFIVIYFVL